MRGSHMRGHLLLLCLGLAASLCQASLLEVPSLTSSPLLGVTEGSTLGFLGIPYARSERWRKSVPVTSLDDATTLAVDVSGTDGSVFDARNFGARCFQSGGAFGDMKHIPLSEDCLFLNVWVPSSSVEGGNLVDEPLKPVMVFIHGGGFVLGSGSDPYINAQPFNDQGIVFVSLNYRLGSLGFLAATLMTGEEDTANFGLLDQQLALEWVQEHIAAFGGDPTRVTLFGESAGAMSTLWHLSVSSLARTTDDRPLFSKVILQSAPYASGVAASLGIGLVEELGARLGCTVTDHDALLSCLRGKKFLDLSEVSPGFSKERKIFWHTLKAAFAPYQDKYYPNLPYQAVIEGNYDTSIDVMLGTCKDEGTLFSWMTFPILSIDEVFFSNIVQEVFEEAHHAEVMSRYHPDMHDGAQVALAEVSNDMYFQCPNRVLADAFAAHHEVYKYVFAQKPTSGVQFLEVYHAAELPFMFQAPIGGFLFPSELTAEEQYLGQSMSEYWGTFAISGRPSSVTSGQEWPTYGENETTMVLTTEMHTVSAYKDAQCDFWAVVFPNSEILNNPAVDEMRHEPSHSYYINGTLFRWIRGAGAFLFAVPCVLLPMLLFLYLSINKKKGPEELAEKKSQ